MDNAIHVKTDMSIDQDLQPLAVAKVFKKLLDDHLPVGEGWRLVTAYGFSKWPNDKKDGSPSMRPCPRCSKNVFLVDDVRSHHGNHEIPNWYDILSEDTEEGKTARGKCHR